MYLGCGILSGGGDGWGPDASHHHPSVLFYFYYVSPNTFDKNQLKWKMYILAENESLNKLLMALLSIILNTPKSYQRNQFNITIERKKYVFRRIWYYLNKLLW